MVILVSFGSWAQESCILQAHLFCVGSFVVDSYNLSFVICYFVLLELVLIDFSVVA